MYLCKNDNSCYNVANLWVDEHQHPGACGRPGLHVCRDFFKRTFLGATGGHVQGLLLSSVDSIDLFTNE